MEKMIRNKTYRNFMIIKNKLVKEKGYSPEEATKITHRIFDNVLYDKNCGDRSAEYFYDMVLSAEDFAKQQESPRQTPTAEKKGINKK